MTVRAHGSLERIRCTKTQGGRGSCRAFLAPGGAGSVEEPVLEAGTAAAPLAVSQGERGRRSHRETATRLSSPKSSGDPACRRSESNLNGKRVEFLGSRSRARNRNAPARQEPRPPDTVI